MTITQSLINNIISIPLVKYILSVAHINYLRQSTILVRTVSFTLCKRYSTFAATKILAHRNSMNPNEIERRMHAQEIIRKWKETKDTVFDHTSRTKCLACIYSSNKKKMLPPMPMKTIKTKTYYTEIYNGDNIDKAYCLFVTLKGIHSNGKTTRQHTHTKKRTAPKTITNLAE